MNDLGAVGTVTDSHSGGLKHQILALGPYVEPNAVLQYEAHGVKAE